MPTSKENSYCALKTVKAKTTFQFFDVETNVIVTLSFKINIHVT